MTGSYRRASTRPSDMIRDTLYAFSPTPLIVAGAVLVVLGFIWLAHRRRKGAEAKLKEWRMGNEQLRSQREAELALTSSPRKLLSLRALVSGSGNRLATSPLAPRSVITS